MHDADSKIMSGVQHHQQDPFAYDDTSFVSTVNTRDSTSVIRCNYWTDRTLWKTAFAHRNEASQNFVWYTDSIVNVISHYYTRANSYSEDDTLCFDVHRFDKNTGELLGQRELLRVADDDHEKHYDFKLSADSSQMLVSLHDDYEVVSDDQNADDEPELWNAELLLLRADMAEVQKAKIGIIVSEDYADDFNPQLAISNNGVVFYTFSRILSDTITQQSVVRLDISQKRSDTLTALIPRTMTYSPWSIENLDPHEPLLRSLSGDTVLLAWPYFSRKSLKLLVVSKLDFQSKTFVFTTTLPFDEETCEYLIDDDMNNFKLSHGIVLPLGETLLVLEKIVNSSSGGYMPLPPVPTHLPSIPFKVMTVPSAPSAPTVPSTPSALAVPSAPVIPLAPSELSTDNGPIVVVKFASTGAVQWQSSIIKDESTMTVGHYSSYHVTDSSLCLLYRDTDVADGITFSEFMLSDGRSRWRELAVTFSDRSAWYSNHTLWLRDGIVLYGGEGFSHYVCIRVSPSSKYTWLYKDQARRIVGEKRVDE